MVLVYDFKTIEFDNDGLGAIAPSSCAVTEEINGAFELELTHPIDAFDKWKRLQKNNIIRADTHRGVQTFRIYRVVKNAVDSTVKVNARHIFYDLLFNLVEDARPTNKNGTEAGQQILLGCQYVTPFTFSSDITHTATAYYIRQSPVQAFLGDTDQSFLSRWGGEIVRNNFSIAINARLGADKGVRIAYGKNLAGLEFNEDSSSVVTRIMPTASTADNQLLRLPEKYVDSSHVNDYQFPIISVEATGFKIGEEVNGTVPYPDEESSFAAMRQYVSDRYLSGADVPKLSLAVNFVDWKDVTRYEKYKSLLTVGLGDDVTVEYLPFEINVKLRVCAVSYNCLTDQYETLTIGEKKISVVNSINSASQKIDEVQQEVTVTNQKVSVIDASVSDINSDDKLTPIEKSAALRDWSSFSSEKSSLSTQATAFGITTELNSYENAFQLLSNYLNDGALYTTGIPLWLDSDHISQTTAISGVQYRQYFADYYAARNSLVQAITAKLKVLADTAQNGVNTNAGAITTIDTTLVEIQTAADALTTQVTNISDEISNDATGIEVRLETAQSEIEQHATSIASKVESSVYETYVSDNNTKVESMNTQLTTIEQGLSSIEFSVGHTGYRNLIKNSAGKNGTNFWTVTGTVSQLENTNISNNTISNSAFNLSANSSISQPFPLRAGYQHTLSFLYQSSTAAGQITASVIQSNTETVVYNKTNTGTGWTYVTVPFSSTDTTCTVKILAVAATLISDIIVTEGTNIAPWVQSDEELYTTNVIIDGAGIEIGTNASDIHTHISNDEFAISRGVTKNIEIAPDGTRLQQTIIEDDLTVGCIKEIVRGTSGIDFVVL